MFYHRYDRVYKVLLSYPEMVRATLEAFVEEDWISGLDWFSLSRMPDTFVGETLRKQESDLIWRVRDQEGEWLFLLFEFQSRVDWTMAVRTVGYATALTLALEKQTHTIQRQCRSPTLCPIVLYHGQARWRAATKAEALHAAHLTRSIKALQLGGGYLLYDVRQARRDDDNNPVCLLLQLLDVSCGEQVVHVLRGLRRWLAAHPWLVSLPGLMQRYIEQILEIGVVYPGIEFDGLVELEHMFESKAVKSWMRRLRQEGREQGIEEGVQRGFIEGQLKLIKTMLERKFGPLSAQDAARLARFDVEALHRLSNRFTEVHTLEELLD